MVACCLAAIVLLDNRAPPLAAFAGVGLVLPVCFWSLLAGLSFSQAGVVRSRALLFLATGALIAALLGVAQLVTIGGAFLAHDGLRIGATATWLWAFAVSAFAAFVVAYGRARATAFAPWRPDDGLRYAGVAVIVAAALSSVSALLGMHAQVSAGVPWTAGTLPAALAGFACAVALAACVVSTRVRTVLDLWVIVAVVALACDALITVASGGRVTTAWYVASADEVVASFGLLAVLLIDVTLISQRLALLAVVDPVCGLANRRALDERLETYVGNRRRRDDTLSVIMLDIDNFKGFNDRHGHAAGDACLRTVADIIRHALVRAGDFAARYGGEEFVIVLPSTERGGALVVAERIRHAVERLAVVAKGSSRITVSCGVVTVPAQVGTSVEALLGAADAALYEAKAAGRNCIVEADSQRSARTIVSVS